MHAARTLSAGLLLLAAGCGEAGPVATLEPAPDYWEPVEDFFAGEAVWETQHENEAEPVKMTGLLPLPFLEEGGYDLPFLKMAPPAEVRVEVPADAGTLRFEAFVAGALETGAEERRAARFEVLVDGAVVAALDRSWWPEMSAAERQWQALPAVEVPPGSQLRLRTVATVAGEEPLAIGFGRPRLLRRTPRPGLPADAPNVVFLLMDTLRSDVLTPYGGEHRLTPHLAALAARGTLFENAYSTASWTWPSTASVLTGLLPEQHGVLAQYESYLQGDARTLPEVLREAGYRTGGFSLNPLIDICHNYDQGFDSYRDASASFDPTGVVEGEVRAWLREHAAGSPFFLYLHLVDPHMPYDPLERFAGKGPRSKIFDYQFFGMAIRDNLIEAMKNAADSGRPFDPLQHVEHSTIRTLQVAYWRCVQSADYWVGEFLAELDALGLTENTIFVFTSDHGEEFLDHDLLAHASSLHRELVHVPMIVAGPGWEPGRRVATPVSNRHLAATLARMVGADAGALGDGDALDLAATSSLPERPVYFSTRTSVWRGRKGVPAYGMLAGDRLVHVYEIPEADRTVGDDGTARVWDTRVYDLAQDPAARVDVSGRDPRETEALRDMVLRNLEQLRERRAASGSVSAVGESENQLLRQIGYIGDEE